MAARHIQQKPLKIEYSKDFARDLADLAKRQPNVLIDSKYINAIHYLLNRMPLPASYVDHALKGEWQNYRDCHIQGDLVLIYRYIEGETFDTLRFARLNSHSKLAL